MKSFRQVLGIDTSGYQIQVLGVRKHVLAASLASTDNVDVTAVKRHKLEEAAAAQRQAHQPSVQDDDDDDDDDDTHNTNLRPRDASRILEAADGSDDIELDVGMGGHDSDDEELPGLEEVDDSDEEDKEDKEGELAETDEEELGKSLVNYH